MAADKNPTPAPMQPERPGVVSLRLRRPMQRDHAKGGERCAVRGGGKQAAALPRRGSPSRLGVGDGGRRREGAGGAGHGGDGELSAWSASAGGAGVVHTCHVCFKTFDRVKALHGHKRSCRAASEELPLAAPQLEREKKQRVEKMMAEDAGLLARALKRSWAMTGRRQPGRSPNHGGVEWRAPPTKVARVAAQDRAPIAAILRKVTRLQVGEADLDQPWAAEMVRGAQGLMLLNAGEAGPVAGSHSGQCVVTFAIPPPAKIPEVIVIDEEEEDAERNNAVAQINTSAVTIAISAPDAAATVTVAPAPNAAAAAVTITAAPATPSAVATAAAPDADPAKGTEIASSNGNGSVVAAAGACDEIKVYRCPKCFNKTFSSYQALGGHMAYHKIGEKRAKELQDIKDVAAAVAAVMSGREQHVCTKCSKTFPTGQALGGHMRLHYTGPLLGAGKTTAWAAPSTAGGSSLPSPAAAGSSTFVFTLLKQEEPPKEMAMTGKTVPVRVPAGTAFRLSLPASTNSSFPLAFAAPKQEVEKTPEVMAMAPCNGARGGFRLFGVDIAEVQRKNQRSRSSETSVADPSVSVSGASNLA